MYTSTLKFADFQMSDFASNAMLSYFIIKPPGAQIHSYPTLSSGHQQYFLYSHNSQTVAPTMAPMSQNPEFSKM